MADSRSARHENGLSMKWPIRIQATVRGHCGDAQTPAFDEVRIVRHANSGITLWHNGEILRSAGP